VKHAKTLLLFLFIASASWAASSKVVSIKTGAPGNLFFTDQKILIKINVIPQNAFQPQKLTAHIINYRNQLFRTVVFPVSSETGMTIEDNIGFLQAGYYSYVVEAEGAEEQKSVGFIKFGVIRKTQSKTPRDESPFAVDAFLSWRVSSFELAAEAAKIMNRIGIIWMRDRISWNDVQPAKGKWNWEKYDAAAKAQYVNGMKVLQVFQDTAVWASERQTGKDSLCQKYAPDDTYLYYRWAANAASRYKEEVSAWELWNEFDIPVFFMGSADEYARILKAGYLGIKKGNPYAAVLSGSITFGSGDITFGPQTFSDKEGERFIEKVFENGGGEYFDILNVHHYGPVEGVAEKIKRCKDLMRRYGYSKPIWLTEIGSTATSVMEPQVAQSEYLQSRYLVKAYALALAEGASRIFYFSLPNFVEHGASFWGLMEEKEGGWQPKPALIALANMSYTLENMNYFGRYETNLPVEALLFSQQGRGCLVLWSRDGKQYKPSVFFKNTQKNPIIRDIYGEDTDRRNVLVCTLDIGAVPTYLCDFNIHDLDRDYVFKPEREPAMQPSDFSQGIKDIWVEIRDEGTTVGIFSERIKGEARIYNVSGKDSQGILHIDAISSSDSLISILREPARTVSDGYASIPFEYPIERSRLKNLSEPHHSEMILRAYFKEAASGKSTPPAIRYYEFVPPIQISRAGFLKSNSGDIGTTVALTNTSAAHLDILLSLEPESRFRCLDTPQKIKLSQHETLPVFFPLQPVPMAINEPHSARVQISATIGDMNFTRESFLEYDTIARTFLPFEIDGKPAGWKFFQPFTLEGSENLVHGKETVKKAEELRAKVYSAWDEQHLYLFAVVKDKDVLNPYRHENPWTGDALELFFDMRKGDELGSPFYSAGVFQIFAIPPDKNNPQADFKVWQPDGCEFHGVKIASVVMNDYYTIEMAIPWNNLIKDKVAPNMEFGFEITIDERDSGDYEHRQMVWRGGSNNWRDPSLFSRIKLVTHNK